MGSVGNNGNASSTNVPAEVQERRDRARRAEALGLPNDTLGQLATDNYDNAGLEDAIRRGWITQAHANIISENTVREIQISKNQVEIDTDRFRAYTGKQPSGLGTWSFDMDGQSVSFSGRYSVAKKEAIAEAARRGIRRVRLET